MKHEWERLAPYIGFFPTPRESYQCNHCFQVRLGDPLEVGQDKCWGGPFLVWNKLDDCDEPSLERAREGRERCGVGAGIESFGAFVGGRELGFLFDGRIPYRA